MVMVSLKPEPIPLDLKVIMIGNSSIYQTLLAMDSDFRKLFKVKVEHKSLFIHFNNILPYLPL